MLTTGENVSIAPTVRVCGEVTIGDNTIIEDFCVLGRNDPGPIAPLSIGANSLVRSHTVLYSGSRLGEGLETGHHVLIREGTIAGKNLRIGSYSSIEGACMIGDYCRFHGYVQVGRGSKIGNFVWLFSLSILLNDPLPPSELFRPPILEDGVVVCAEGMVMPGACLGRGSFLAAGGRVEGKIPEGAVVNRKGKVISHVTYLASILDGRLRPWVTQYGKEHYPQEAWERLEELQEKIIKSRKEFIDGM